MPGYNFIIGLDKNQKLTFEGCIKAYEFIEQREIDKKEATLSNLKSIDMLSNDLMSATDKVIEEVNKKKSKLESDIADFMKKEDGLQQKNSAEWEGKFEELNSQLNNLSETHNKKLIDLEDTYEKKLEFTGPVRLWKVRAETYRNQARWWLSSFVASSTFVIVILLVIFYHMPKALYREGEKFVIDPAAVTSLLILATIVSFGAYLIRLFARLTFSTLHLVRDSEEREQLTRVFIALRRKEGKINEKDSLIVFDSLFSRAQTGLLGEDSAPTMPGLSSLIEKYGK